MNLEQLKEEWSKDTQIDDIELDKSSLEVPKLHAKYSSLLSDKLVTLKKLQLELSKITKLKWLWYSGKLSQEEINKLGWEDDPFDGLKVMKSDYNYYFNADDDIQNLNGKIEYLNVCIQFLQKCMENITWRHQTIKNTIDWRKFMAGQ
jgi:hypothetical protein